MSAPKCTPVQGAERYAGKAVRAILYEGPDLVIEIDGGGFGRARVSFANVVGFRVLDEGELTEFWDEYSEPNGWLYRVERGGWMELEQQRASFNAPVFHANLSEYLLVDDMCVSVLCGSPPRIVAAPLR